MARRWIRLDSDWDEAEWLDELDGTAAGCWPRLLCKVKRDGVRGRCRRPSLRVQAKKWKVPLAAIEALEAAALLPRGENGELPPALRIEDGDWIVTDWSQEQEVDATATERKRRQRDRERSRPVTRDIRDRRESRDLSSRATETPTETEEQITDPSGAAAPERARAPRKRAARKKAAAPSWSGRACDTWTKYMGGTAPGGRIGKALKPLVEKYGEDVVLTEFDTYMAEMVKAARGGFATAEDFATRYGYYRENGVKMPKNGNGKQSADEKLMQRRAELENVDLTGAGG